MLDDKQLKKLITENIEKGTYRLTKHAIEEQRNDEIDLPDILAVLKKGYHEKDKTTLSTKQDWKYAIRGRTVDGRELRIIIAFADHMLVITVIDVSL